MKISVRMLLLNLQRLDRRWANIPQEEIKGTAPRTLVNGMNTHLSRFKKEHTRV